MYESAQMVHYAAPNRTLEVLKVTTDGGTKGVDTYTPNRTLEVLKAFRVGRGERDEYAPNRTLEVLKLAVPRGGLNRAGSQSHP